MNPCKPTTCICLKAAAFAVHFTCSRRNHSQSIARVEKLTMSFLEYSYAIIRIRKSRTKGYCRDQDSQDYSFRESNDCHADCDCQNGEILTSRDAFVSNRIIQRLQKQVHGKVENKGANQQLWGISTINQDRYTGRQQTQKRILQLGQLQVVGRLSESSHRICKREQSWCIQDSSVGSQQLRPTYLKHREEAFPCPGQRVDP